MPDHKAPLFPAYQRVRLALPSRVEMNAELHRTLDRFSQTAEGNPFCPMNKKKGATKTGNGTARRTAVLNLMLASRVKNPANFEQPKEGRAVMRRKSLGLPEE